MTRFCRVDGCEQTATDTAVLRFTLRAEGEQFERQMGFCQLHARMVRGELPGDGASVTHSVVDCDACGLQPMDAIPNEDGSGGVWACSKCGKQHGLWLDGGTIDLGLVTDEQLREANEWRER